MNQDLAQIISSLKTTLTRTSIMLGQQRDLAQKFEALETELKKMVHALEDEQRDRRTAA